MIAVLGVHGGRVPAGTEELLAGAELVAGGGEVLDALAPAGAAPAGARRRPRAGAAPSWRARARPACVLASGDPGFFGIVRALASASGAERLDVHPAPSSVAVAFGRLGLPWDDAVVVSAHGRDPRAGARTPRCATRRSRSSPPRPPTRRGSPRGCAGRRLVVAERLGHADERIRAATPEELAGETFAQPNVVLVLAPSAPTATRPRVAAAHPGALGAARRRVRAPRRDDHQGRGAGARARRASAPDSGT